MCIEKFLAKSYHISLQNNPVPSEQSATQEKLIRKCTNKQSKSHEMRGFYFLHLGELSDYFAVLGNL